MTQIILDGVIESRRERAEREIQQMLENIFEGRRNPIDTIIVTNNLDDLRIDNRDSFQGSQIITPRMPV